MRKKKKTSKQKKLIGKKEVYFVSNCVIANMLVEQMSSYDSDVDWCTVVERLLLFFGFLENVIGDGRAGVFEHQVILLRLDPDRENGQRQN